MFFSVCTSDATFQEGGVKAEVISPCLRPSEKAQRNYQWVTPAKKKLYSTELQEHTRGFQLNLLLLIYRGYCDETTPSSIDIYLLHNIASQPILF